jgi:hypothetical protein
MVEGRLVSVAQKTRSPRSRSLRETFGRAEYCALLLRGMEIPAWA